MPPTTPVFDAFTYLGFLAGRTEHLRLGTHVYNLGLRHPFVAARAVQTLDLVSGGRVEFGIGASWLEQEWVAAELDFRTRGRRVDEALAVCKRLWTEDQVAHEGEFFRFDAVAFEPKPVQRPWPPILVGGESDAALRRAAHAGDGWIGMSHTFESAAVSIERLRAAARRGGTLERAVRGVPRWAGGERRRRGAVGGAGCHPARDLAVAAVARSRRRDPCVRRPRRPGAAVLAVRAWVRWCVRGVQEQRVGVPVEVADRALRAERHGVDARLLRVADADLVLADVGRGRRTPRGPCPGPCRSRTTAAARSPPPPATGRSARRPSG